MMNHFTRSLISLTRSNIKTAININKVDLTRKICISSNLFKDTTLGNDTNHVHKRIKDLITNSNKRVFVFMKGVPSEPLCGYSNAVVKILDAYEVDFDSVNVLEDQEIRQELKTYSDWPTIPQVFVDGSFVGGCDILLQMHQSGELKDLFNINNSQQESKSSQNTSPESESNSKKPN